jgi:tetratricopeptide (TPR) repeat protein
MIDETRVRALVEDALDSDRTPEEVCSDAPELLADVRHQWARARLVQAELDAIFKAPETTRKSSTDEAWPALPGHEVRAVLGRGGVGVVYRATHVKLHRDVAVKMLRSGESASSDERARFLREAEAVASLRHPNIVQVHDFGELVGRSYLTMELVEGGSLAQKLAGEPQPASAACTWLIVLAEAVQVAHEGGIVHRDLKPSNVLVTLDGTLKIADFGLARRLDGGGSLTASGVGVGTPSYMAPEQVTGSTGAIGIAADVYALGAILYEMLTGRPPFRAGSALATQLQVLKDEPVPPSRLNPKVPRDLETICAQCLHKDPARRYASAAALAADLRRFQHNEPIAARRTGAFERALKWVRRNPARAAAFAGGALLVCGTLGAALWLMLQRAAVERLMSTDMHEVALHQQASSWSDARAALERAKARLGAGDTFGIGQHEALRAQVAQVERELDLVTCLDTIRLNRAAVVEGRYDAHSNRLRADHDYEGAFRSAGFGSMGDDPARVAARVAESNIRASLLPALDDWAVCAAYSDDAGRQRWVLEVARRADPDPTGWRDRLREPTARDRAALEALAAVALEAGASLPCLIALAERLAAAGGDARTLLTELQRRHPGDFWANFALAEALRETAPAESVRYLQAALALRPSATVVLNNLGHALAHVDRLDEAAEHFRAALALDPTFAVAHSNLGNTYSLAGRHAEAIEAFVQAIDYEPREALSHANLAKALIDAGRMDEALAAARRAVDLQPSLAKGHVNLGMVFARTGRSSEAIERYRLALELGGAAFEAHLNLSVVLGSTGQLDEALDQSRRALELAPQNADAHATVGNVLRARGELDEALRHGEEAVRLEPQAARHHNDLGMTLAVARRLEEAAARLREAVRLAPTATTAHNNLGNVLGQLRDFEGAAEHFRTALKLEPDNAQANGALGQALLGLGRLHEAREYLRRGLELFPEGTPQHKLCEAQLRLCEEQIARE